MSRDQERLEEARADRIAAQESGDTEAFVVARAQEEALMRRGVKLSEAETGKPGTNFKQVGPGARKKLSPLIKHYMKKPHPFTSCVRDNTKRFGPERAKRVCAVLKDLGRNTTKWRKGGKVAEAIVLEATLLCLQEAGMRESDVDLLAAWMAQEMGVEVIQEADSKADNSPGKCASCGKGMPKAIKSKRAKCPHCGHTVKAEDMEEMEIREAVLHTLRTINWDPSVHPRSRLGLFIDTTPGIADSPDETAHGITQRLRYGKFDPPRSRAVAMTTWPGKGKADPGTRPDWHNRPQRDPAKPDWHNKPQRDPIAKMPDTFKSHGNLPRDAKVPESFQRPGRPPGTARHSDTERAMRVVDVLKGDGSPQDVIPDVKRNKDGSYQVGHRRVVADGTDWKIDLSEPKKGTPEFDAAQREQRALNKERYGKDDPWGDAGYGVVSGEPARRGGQGRTGVSRTEKIERAQNAAIDKVKSFITGGKADPGTGRPSREEREAAARTAFPEGSSVTTTVYGIGGRSEEVTGKVVGHKYGNLRVQTKNHGTLSVELGKARPAGKADPGTDVRRAGGGYEVLDGSGRVRVFVHADSEATGHWFADDQVTGDDLGGHFGSREEALAAARRRASGKADPGTYDSGVGVEGGTIASNGSMPTRLADDPTFRKHQVNIARQTLRMSPEGAKIAGGMSPAEAKRILAQNARRKGRKIREIAQEIYRDWDEPTFSAAPYLDSMRVLDESDERVDTIVRGFLSNAGSWQGEVAQRVKKELVEALDVS